MKRTSWWVGAIALLVLVVAAAWWFMRDRNGGVSYRTAQIERGSLVAAVLASGTVNPVTQVSVGSQVSGQIKELFADFNSAVKRGQLIARIDPESFEYRVRQASADVDASRASVLTAQANVQSALASVSKAQVDLAQARRDLQQKKDLVAQNFIAASEVDKAQASVDTLAESLKVTQAQVAVARAQASNAAANVKQREALLAQSRIDLERTQIRSPVDGIVIKRSIETGQTVAASLQAPELFVIARNLNDMQVEASIDEADISRVKLDQKVSFTIDAFPGRTFEGKVGQMRKAAVASQNVVTYTVVVAFGNPSSMVLPGMTANVRIVTDTRDNVLKVPNAALRVRIAGVETASAESAPPVASALLPNAMAQTAASEPGGALREKQKHQRLLAEPGTRQTTRGRIYLLGENGKPRAYSVRLGISDGVMTELIVPPNSSDAQVLKEEAAVVTAVIAASTTTPSTPRMPRTPF
jgi:HlyD family secretion protein